MKWDPEEYELFVKAFYERLLSKNYTKSTSLYHRKKYKGLSGQEHEIDLSLEVDNSAYGLLIVFECKAYNRKVKIVDLLAFSERIKDIRASKGVCVTTEGFESGAIRVARANRIALAILNTKDVLGATLNVKEDPDFFPSYIRLFHCIVLHHFHYKLAAENLFDYLSSKKKIDDKSRFESTIRRLSHQKKDSNFFKRLFRILAWPLDLFYFPFNLMVKPIWNRHLFRRYGKVPSKSDLIRGEGLILFDKSTIYLSTNSWLEQVCSDFESSPYI